MKKMEVVGIRNRPLTGVPSSENASDSVLCDIQQSEIIVTDLTDKCSASNDIEEPEKTRGPWATSLT